jgi:hypothetical protein
VKTLHLDPDTREQAAPVTEKIDRLLGEGKSIVVTVAEEQELLSPQQAAERLGFSRQHVVRLTMPARSRHASCQAPATGKYRWAQCSISSNAANAHESYQTRSRASLTS